MFFMIESQLKYEQLKKSLEEELHKKETLKTYIKALKANKKSSSKKVIVFLSH
jgi:UDP-N-acetylglucosamine:LPS N-acetylglucosamine transferase